MGIRRASLTFGAAGLLAGGLWGYPIFTIARNAAGESAGIEPGTGGAIVGAGYVGSLAALGGICGRYFDPWAATRPSLVRTAVGAVSAVAPLGFVLMSVIRLDSLS